MAIQVKNESTAQLADDLIDAAQRLEVQAKVLRAAAKQIRIEGLTDWRGPSDAWIPDPVTNQRQHKGGAVAGTCRQVLQVLKYE